jgi:maltooligosyltrehalose trehalohydrolase
LDHLTSPGLLRASTMALLLLPSTPHLFQGQEFASSHAFCYFADHEEELAQIVAKGRRDFLSQFESVIREPLTLPHSPKTFHSSKLDHKERESHSGIYQLHKDLLSLRRNDAVINQQNTANFYVATIGTRALVFRFLDEHFGHRLMVVNLGFDLGPLESQPNPLLTPPVGSKWELALATENVCYGGNGIAPPNEHDEWTYLAQCGYFFREKSA